ncbi:MAG TPA: TaqI-like C-terminal specificity domain-containing protein [Symbiobacteriaceae bacterium]|nr:TaqI-like C-terminal specificity domain-containing protein [Symbiobacteriaceae bacterium]
MDPASTDPGQQVRAALLQAVAGESGSGLTSSEATSLRCWFHSEYGEKADPAGALYQEMLGWTVRADGAGNLVVKRERKVHRATGAYYTENRVVGYMLSRAGEYLPGLRDVIDPACGSGAFLAAFSGRPVRLVGVDADPVALAMCGRNVPSAELVHADALLEDVPSGFDLCIGNPPYISSGLRGAASHDRELQRQLKARYPRTAQYKLNTYPLFIERGLQLVREGGILGYIVPDSFLSGRYFEGLRRLLLEQTLLELTLVCQDFWQHGRVGQSVILFVRKGAPPPGHQVLIRTCRNVDELEDTGFTGVPPHELAWGPLVRFPLITDAREQALVLAMEAAAATSLGQLVQSYSGLIARQGQQSLLRSANPGLHGPWGRLLRSGKEIDRYRLVWEGEEVCLDPGLIKSGGCLPYYRNPKILLRQTADCLRAVYDEEGYYCLNNIHLLIPRHGEVPVRALLGLINSEPVNRFYRAMTMEAGRLYPQVDLDLLEALPIPVLPTDAAKELDRLVRARESAAPGEAAQLDEAIDDMARGLYAISRGGTW